MKHLMCHLFVQKCFKLLMKHSSQADDKVNIYIENCLSCDQNQMHIILCSLSACYFLSKFLRVTFYVRVCWLLQLQQVHMKLLCRYFDNPSQFIFNQSDTMDHKTSKQCAAPAPVPLLLRSYHSRYWPTSDCCPSSPSDLYQKTLIS